MFKIDVGWAKEQSDVPIKFSAPNVMGTLRFAHPTGCGKFFS